MSIQLPDLSNSINSQLINKSPASPSNPHSPSNCRHIRTVNPPRRLEDYYLGAVGKNSVDNFSNNNFVNDDDITIGYSYPNSIYSIPSPSTNFVYSTSIPIRQLCSHFFNAPIDLRDIEVVASALRCPWRLTPTIVRSLVVSRRLRGAP